MEYLHNGFTLEICPGGFPLSTDSILLADFVKLPRQASVLDLGAGCGTLGLLLCASDSNCTVTGVELSEAAHQMALENSTRNGLDDRLQSICANLTDISQLFPAGAFQCCVSNPPYFASGPESRQTPVARQELQCTLADVLRAAAWGLKYGGDFYIVHRPERMAELFAQASACHLEPKRLRLVRHKQGGPVTLILVHCRKGAKPGLNWEELTLFHPDGTPTADYRRIYHL